MALALTLGVAVVGGVGWFLLSWLAIREPAGDAIGEALGVAFGALIVASVVGAVRAARRRSTESSDSAETGEGRETLS